MSELWSLHNLGHAYYTFHRWCITLPRDWSKPATVKTAKVIHKFLQYIIDMMHFQFCMDDAQEPLPMVNPT